MACIDKRDLIFWRSLVTDLCDLSGHIFIALVVGMASNNIWPLQLLRYVIDTHVHNSYVPCIVQSVMHIRIQMVARNALSFRPNGSRAGVQYTGQ